MGLLFFEINCIIHSADAEAASDDVADGDGNEVGDEEVKESEAVGGDAVK